VAAARGDGGEGGREGRRHAGRSATQDAVASLLLGGSCGGGGGGGDSLLNQQQLPVASFSASVGGAVKHQGSGRDGGGGWADEGATTSRRVSRLLRGSSVSGVVGGSGDEYAYEGACEEADDDSQTDQRPARGYPGAGGGGGGFSSGGGGRGASRRGASAGCGLQAMGRSGAAGAPQQQQVRRATLGDASLAVLREMAGRHLADRT
jgi:hypothetical protein